MHITRRAALVGTAASFAVARLAAATPPPITATPFLRVCDDRAVLWRRLCATPYAIAEYYSANPPLPLPTREYGEFAVNASDGIPVISVEDAEDRLLDLIPEPLIQAARYADGCPRLALHLAINRARHRIAARTRLYHGGKMLLMSREAVSVFTDEGDTLYFQSTPETTTGRWTQVGRLNDNTIYVGEHPALRERRVIVMHTAGDNHAVIIRSGGALHLVVDPDQMRAAWQAPEHWLGAIMGASQDFFEVISVEA